MSTSRGSIEQRSNGTYRVVYRYGGKRHRSPTFPSRDLARAFQDTLAGDVARGIEYDPAGPKTAFEIYAERWFGSRLKNVDVAQSRARERSFLDVHLIPRWGAVQIGAIRRIEVQSWVNELAVKRKPRTVRDILQVFGQILRDAAADGLLPAGSPVGGNMIKLPKVAADDDHQVLEHEELEHLLAIAEDSWPAEYPAIRVLSDTGMRLGELFALEVVDINFDEGWLEVSESLKKQSNGRYVRGTRSKSARRRRVDLWPETLEALGAQRRTHSGDLVFAGADGGVMNLDNWRSRHWAKVV
ncbi:MAG: tyrosine-type recombinase/integrase [Actinomycetes bacterium]